MRATAIVLLALGALAATGCSSVQSGAVLRFGEGLRGASVSHEVPFRDGRLLGIGYDHAPVWREGADAWEGRKAAGIAKASEGDRVTVRTVWEEVGAEVIAVERDGYVLRADAPLSPGCSGSGAWLDDDRIIGIVTHGKSGDFRRIRVAVPAGAAGLEVANRR